MPLATALHRRRQECPPAPAFFKELRPRRLCNFRERTLKHGCPPGDYWARFHGKPAAIGCVLRTPARGEEMRRVAALGSALVLCSLAAGFAACGDNSGGGGAPEDAAPDRAADSSTPPSVDAASDRAVGAPDASVDHATVDAATDRSESDAAPDRATADASGISDGRLGSDAPDGRGIDASDASSDGDAGAQPDARDATPDSDASNADAGDGSPATDASDAGEAGDAPAG
jgi:hypothetical protein